MSEMATTHPDARELATGAEVVEPTVAGLAAMAHWAPEGGVLSVLGDAPTGGAGDEARIAIRNDIAALTRRVHDDGRRETRTALAEVLARHGAAIDAVTRAEAGAGLGRALFLPLDGGPGRVLATQCALPAQASLAPLARLGPLVRAGTVHRAIGLILAAADRLEVTTVAMGVADRLADWEVTGLTDGRERRGPARANPGRAQHSVTHVERHDAHIADQRRRALAPLVQRAAGLAGGAGWVHVIVAGDPGVAEEVADGLRAAGLDGCTVVHSDLAGESAGRQADGLAVPIAAVRSEWARAAVDRALEGAASGGRGAVGLDAVLPALAEGRVARLLLSAAGDAPGWRAPDGRPLTTPADGAASVPSLHDVMTARAIATDAEVLIPDGDAEERLADVAVAAELRW